VSMSRFQKSRIASEIGAADWSFSAGPSRFSISALTLFRVFLTVVFGMADGYPGAAGAKRRVGLPRNASSLWKGDRGGAVRPESVPSTGRPASRMRDAVGVT